MSTKTHISFFNHQKWWSKSPQRPYHRKKISKNLLMTKKIKPTSDVCYLTRSTTSPSSSQSQALATKIKKSLTGSSRTRMRTQNLWISFRLTWVNRVADKMRSSWPNGLKASSISSKMNLKKVAPKNSIRVSSFPRVKMTRVRSTRTTCSFWSRLRIILQSKR